DATAADEARLTEALREEYDEGYGEGYGDGFKDGYAAGKEHGKNHSVTCPKCKPCARCQLDSITVGNLRATAKDQTYLILDGCDSNGLRMPDSVTTAVGSIVLRWEDIADPLIITINPRGTPIAFAGSREATPVVSTIGDCLGLIARL